MSEARPGHASADAREDDDRARGALLGTFVGDALGMPYEGRPAAEIPTVLEMEEARLGRGTYTDDTQMMIALAESLLRCERVDPEDLARTFLARYDPRRGYGAGTIRVFELWQHGEPVELAARRVFDGAGSFGNGAAMRVAPVAVRFTGDDSMLAAQADASARVTHAHPIAIDGAVVQVVAVAAALKGDDPLVAATAGARTRELRERLEALGDASATTAMVSSAAHESVPVAIVAAARAESFDEAVSAAIRCGGDTDTTGAMAGAIAGARFGAAAIPARWVEALEDGEHGRLHVLGLARELVRARDGAPG